MSPLPVATTAVGGEHAVLPSWGLRSVSIQMALLIAAAFVLPTLAHTAGLPVRLLLPMHWPVILAGLCYGWRSGAIVGMAAPTVSFLLSGHPAPLVLPAMTVELGAYGLLAGLAFQHLGVGRRMATLLAGAGGRLVFVATMLLTGAIDGALVPYLQAALMPGLVALVAQVLLLAPLAAWWVRREQGA